MSSQIHVGQVLEGQDCSAFGGDVRARERFMVRHLGRSHISAPLNATLSSCFSHLQLDMHVPGPTVIAAHEPIAFF
jgi:hypothetical protein